ncbi:MAG: UDP-N-acetylmuramoyl-tripeptide--D-alanyl-D-alanine ligase [Actinobacteria bacterium]|nr:UDP-N-acetylmuramoyl-tripeptide--D-alanyl-D-alanine ligase [Actinomycetota bacterium]
MIPIPLAELEQAMGAPVSGVDIAVRGISVDTRTVVPGDAFFAIPGARVDPHQLLADAESAGAAALVVERTASEVSVPTIVVENSLEALGHFAHWYWRNRLTCRTIGITGSSGKTTTKDLIAQVLRSYGPTVWPEGSLNTEVGVPLTIVAADQHTRFLVLEMAMRGLGHISYLTRIAAPDVAVVTNVGHAHVGLLGGIDQVAIAKGELVEGMNPDGVAILNADDSRVIAMHTWTRARMVTFGLSSSADIRGERVRSTARSLQFDVIDQRTGERTAVGIEYIGEHNVSNSLAAIAVGIECGMTLMSAAEALNGAQPRSAMRMELVPGAQGVTLINDAYNANPESMKSALTAVVQMNGRSWAVLGEMRELGEFSEALHADVGRHAAESGLDHLVCIGEGTRPMHEAASDRGVESLWLPSTEEAIPVLRARLTPGDVVLVKASRSVGLDRIVTALAQDEGGAAG